VLFRHLEPVPYVPAVDLRDCGDKVRILSSSPHLNGGSVTRRGSALVAPVGGSTLPADGSGGVVSSGWGDGSGGTGAGSSGASAAGGIGGGSGSAASPSHGLTFGGGSGGSLEGQTVGHSFYSEADAHATVPMLQPPWQQTTQHLSRRGSVPGGYPATVHILAVGAEEPPGVGGLAEPSSRMSPPRSEAGLLAASPSTATAPGAGVSGARRATIGLHELHGGSHGGSSGGGTGSSGAAAAASGSSNRMLQPRQSQGPQGSGPPSAASPPVAAAPPPSVSTAPPPPASLLVSRRGGESDTDRRWAVACWRRKQRRLAGASGPIPISLRTSSTERSTISSCCGKGCSGSRCCTGRAGSSCGRIGDVGIPIGPNGGSADRCALSSAIAGDRLVSRGRLRRLARCLGGRPRRLIIHGGRPGGGSHGSHGSACAIQRARSWSPRRWSCRRWQQHGFWWH